MARVIAPFKIVGTLDDLNFYIDQGDVNRVRRKRACGITKKQFKENPIFQTIKNQSAEFKLAVHKAQSFRMVALPFYRRAKDGSFAGRANKLMLDIRAEDNVNPHGARTVEEGLKSIEAREFSIGFEGNRLRPLHKVLKTKYVYEEKTNAFTIENFNPTPT